LTLSDFKVVGKETGAMQFQSKGDNVLELFFYNGAFSAMVDWLDKRCKYPGLCFG
jgi:hypothetical protein